MEQTFTVTDQLEREIIWDALEQYKAGVSDENRPAVEEMIRRVSRTFSWARDEEPDREPSAEQERAWDGQYDGTSLGH